LNKPTAQTVGFFFGFGPAQCAFTSLRDMSLRRNPSVVRLPAAGDGLPPGTQTAAARLRR
jgi:hypothetical protein